MPEDLQQRFDELQRRFTETEEEALRILEDAKAQESKIQGLLDGVRNATTALGLYLPFGEDRPVSDHVGCLMASVAEVRQKSDQTVRVLQTELNSSFTLCSEANRRLEEAQKEIAKKAGTLRGLGDRERAKTLEDAKLKVQMTDLETRLQELSKKNVLLQAQERSSSYVSTQSQKIGELEKKLQEVTARSAAAEAKCIDMSEEFQAMDAIIRVIEKRSSRRRPTTGPFDYPFGKDRVGA